MTRRFLAGARDFADGPKPAIGVPRPLRLRAPTCGLARSAFMPADLPMMRAVINVQTAKTLGSAS